MCKADATLASEQALVKAQEAKAGNTFAVGGVMSTPDGIILRRMRNKVLLDKVINDPTAHGERQIIDWYYNHRNQLPPPGELTIVTSLDPCVMCTGAILTAGINVAVVAADDQAGIDYNQRHNFVAVPEEIRDLAKKQFSYLGIDGGKRAFFGPPASIYHGQSIPAIVAQQCSDVFLSNLTEIRTMISGQDPTPKNIQGPPENIVAIDALRQFDPEAASVRVNFADPGAGIVEVLVRKAEAAQALGHPFDAAALIDPFGNVLLAVGSQQATAPTLTPFMLLTRFYAQARREVDGATNGVTPHPKRCKIVLLQGPGRTTTSLMDLGAYGSTMEGPLPADNPDNLFYVNETQTQEQLAEMVGALPPFYTDTVKVNPRPLGPEAAAAYARLRG